MANRILLKKLMRKSKNEAMWPISLCPMCSMETLASGSAEHQRKDPYNLKSLLLPVPNPVCAEPLLPTQAKRYFGLKLSFEPNFCNSIQ